MTHLRMGVHALICIMILVTVNAHGESSGKQLAQGCAACHGEGGKSNNSLWPNLAGQKRDYLLKQLKDFQSDERKNPIMDPFVKTLSEKDIETLADYFSQLN